MQTKISFGFYDGGAEFLFYDHEKELAEDAEPTYKISFSYDELWQLLGKIYNGLQNSPGKRSIWSRIKAAMK